MHPLQHAATASGECGPQQATRHPESARRNTPHGIQKVRMRGTCCARADPGFQTRICLELQEGLRRCSGSVQCTGTLLHERDVQALCHFDAQP